jgi:hypothetical protein
VRVPALAAIGLVSVLALPASAAVEGSGPFVGQVAQGETDSYVYDNDPSNNPCIQIAVTYTVSLTYTPGSDTLTLAVPGKTVTGANGAATATVWGSPCTRFPLSVTGTSVASTATYAVTVTRQILPPLS